MMLTIFVIELSVVYMLACLSACLCSEGEGFTCLVDRPIKIKQKDKTKWLR